MLPAYAGMILGFCSSSVVFMRAPRVCGDDPQPITIPIDPMMCSPRMRG